jgi:hypothetical protein
MVITKQYSRLVTGEIYDIWWLVTIKVAHEKYSASQSAKLLSIETHKKPNSK